MYIDPRQVVSHVVPKPKSRLTFSGNITLRPSLPWRALPPEIAGSSHPIQSKNEEDEMYLSYISRKQGGETFAEVQDISSISQPDHRNTTQLSSTTTSCVGQRLLGTPLKIGGTLTDQQDQTTAVTSSKTKYEPQDRGRRRGK